MLAPELVEALVKTWPRLARNVACGFVGFGHDNESPDADQRVGARSPARTGGFGAVAVADFPHLLDRPAADHVKPTACGPSRRFGRGGGVPHLWVRPLQGPH